MKRGTIIFLAGLVLLCLIGGSSAITSASSSASYEELGTTGADYFRGDGTAAVVLVPGMRYGRESWHDLAGILQRSGIASVALSDGTYISEAVAFLLESGYTDITLLGASMGGSAVTSELAGKSSRRVNRAVLLAPYGCSPIINENIAKLFIIAKDDPVADYSDVFDCYQRSSGPKKIMEFESTEHAQELFGGEHRERLIRVIYEFIDIDRYLRTS